LVYQGNYTEPECNTSLPLHLMHASETTIKLDCTWNHVFELCNLHALNIEVKDIAFLFPFA